MRNLVDERPSRDLRGRLAWSRAFVTEADCANRDVLDVGCGFGWFELVALDRGARSVTGIELSEQDLSTARAHVREDRASFATGSAIDLPFSDSSFDTVVCWEVLEHLPAGTEERAFAEFARVLRPGGVLYLSTPHNAPLPKLMDAAWWLTGHRHYSRQQVARLATQAGMLVDRVETRGRSWELAHTLNLYVAKWVFRRRPFFERASLRRVDDEWRRPGYTNVFLRAVNPPREPREH